MTQKIVVRTEMEHVQFQVQDVVLQRRRGFEPSQNAVELLEESLVGRDEDPPAAMSLQYPL
jgi:hypothetical protein